VVFGLPPSAKKTERSRAPVSESSEEHGADEAEHGGDSEHIQFQGKVHGSASLVDVVKS